MRILILISAIVLNSCAFSSKENDSSKNLKSFKPFNVLIEQNKCERAGERIPLEKDSEESVRIAKKFFGYTISIPLYGLSILVDVAAGAYGTNDGRMTKFTHEKTKPLRCPDIKYFSERLIDLTRCYKKRKFLKDLEKSKEILLGLLDERQEFYNCLPKNSQISLKSLLHIVLHDIYLAGGEVGDTSKLLEISKNTELFHNDSRVLKKKLLKAVIKGEPIAIHEMLDVGVSPNLRLKSGKSLLMIAIKNKDWGVTQVLANRGANLLWKDKLGNTVSDFANSSRDQRIRKFIRWKLIECKKTQVCKGINP